MKRNRKENIELAEEHIKIAEDLVLEESKDSDEADAKLFKDAAFSLEKAETELEESEEN